MECFAESETERNWSLLEGKANENLLSLIFPEMFTKMLFSTICIKIVLL
jgi:hypothetical protein